MRDAKSLWLPLRRLSYMQEDSACNDIYAWARYEHVTLGKLNRARPQFLRGVGQDFLDLRDQRPPLRCEVEMIADKLP